MSHLSLTIELENIRKELQKLKRIILSSEAERQKLCNVCGEVTKEVSRERLDDEYHIVQKCIECDNLVFIWEEVKEPKSFTKNE